jgi:hypothetical protein
VDNIYSFYHEEHEKQEVFLNQFPEKKGQKTLKTPNFFFSDFSVFGGFKLGSRSTICLKG